MDDGNKLDKNKKLSTQKGRRGKKPSKKSAIKNNVDTAVHEAVLHDEELSNAKNQEHTEGGNAQFGRLMSRKLRSQQMMHKPIERTKTIAITGVTSHLLLFYLFVMSLFTIAGIFVNNYYGMFKLLAVLDQRVAVVIYGVLGIVYLFLLYRFLLEIRNYYIFEVRLTENMLSVKTPENPDFAMEFVISKIQEINVSQSFIGEWLNYGSLMVYLGDKKYVYRRISNIKDFYKHLQKAKIQQDKNSLQRSKGDWRSAINELRSKA